VEAPLILAEGNIVMSAVLVRPRNDRVIAGVCSGIGRRFGIAPNVVRIAFVLSMLIPGPQFLIYIAGWWLIPEDSRY
jgi:phage shock protein PspC (stress-responsive transcriptional regulator)